MALILAADIGGAYARFGLFVLHNDILVLQRQLVFATQEMSSFQEMLSHVHSYFFPKGHTLFLGRIQKYLEQHSKHQTLEDILHRVEDDLAYDVFDAPENASSKSIRLPQDASFFYSSKNIIACYAVPGIIEENIRCYAPNIPWKMDMHSLPKELQYGFLINDFAAQGWACTHPETQLLQTVLAGENTQAPRSLIGAGTGLGMCLVMPADIPRGILHPYVIDSEGGHATFPFVGREEAEYARFLRDKLGYAPIGDSVLSGFGLAALYEFHHGVARPVEEVTSTLKEDSVVLEWFARFYGRCCRNRVLHTCSFGGVFITGGLVQRAPQLAMHKAFADSFYDVQDYSQHIAKTPVSIVTEPFSGLWGAALCAYYSAIRGYYES